MPRPQPPPIGGHRWPKRAKAAAIAALLLAAIATAVVAANQRPAAWQASRTTVAPDPRPYDISITIDADGATIAWTNPPGTTANTLIVTVRATIRTTEILPAVTAFTVRGLGPEGILCAVITAAGPHTAGTATKCAPPPWRQPNPIPTPTPAHS